MMRECSTDELLARAASMHHADQGHDALMDHAVKQRSHTLQVTVITALVHY